MDTADRPFPDTVTGQRPFSADMHKDDTASPLSQGIPFAFPGVPGVGCLFSCRPAGNLAFFPGAEGAPVIGARQKLLSRLKLERWVELLQVHGQDMLVNPPATPVHEASSLQGDGACTNERGLALAVKTADCQPLLVVNRQGTAIAAMHVGWRGNAMNFPASGIKRFCEAFGLEPEDLMAVRGPSLGPLAAEFVNFAREWPPEFRPWFDEQRQTMDLWALTRHQLVTVGLRPEHIFSLDLCTHSLPDVLFSHRRGHRGRQAALIWLCPEARPSF